MCVCMCALHVRQVQADGTTLVAANGETFPGVDALVFATGFNLAAPFAQFDITARGKRLSEVVLTAHPAAYYGTAVAGFPNLFTLNGLNTGALVHICYVYKYVFQGSQVERLTTLRVRIDG